MRRSIGAEASTIVYQTQNTREIEKANILGLNQKSTKITRIFMFPYGNKFKSDLRWCTRDKK